ncbi:MAG: riboflavin synthase [Desulfobacterales bacterium]
MFTGIIEGTGRLASLRSTGKGSRMTVEADFPLDGVGIGASIAVNGACLTVVHLDGTRFQVDLSPESLATTTFGEARTGERLNLERALRLSDRLDGHLVSGHVDGIGSIASRTRSGNALVIRIDVPERLTRYMILKGSVAVDGVSLTINRLSSQNFDITLIPHTAGITTVGVKPPGSRVNIETDLIGKYVERLLEARSGKHSGATAEGIDREFLARSGFL